MAENINLVNVRAIINLVIADLLLVLHLAPLTAKRLIQVVRLVVMIFVRPVIPRVTQAVVMIPVAQTAEQPVINRKPAVMIPVPADIRKQNRAVVTIQRPPAAEIPVTKQKNVNHNVMTLVRADFQNLIPEAVMIQEPPVAEVPVINQKPAVMTLAQADIQRPSRAAVMIQRPPVAERLVINQNLVALHLIVLHALVLMKALVVPVAMENIAYAIVQTAFGLEANVK